MRDALTAQVPVVLHASIYATAAIAGIALYLALQALHVRRNPAALAGVATLSTLRLTAVVQGWHLPVFQLS